MRPRRRVRQFMTTAAGAATYVVITRPTGRNYFVGSPPHRMRADAKEFDQYGIWHVPQRASGLQGRDHLYMANSERPAPTAATSHLSPQRQRHP